jgi:Zn-dependent protease with chaperone function
MNVLIVSFIGAILLLNIVNWAIGLRGATGTLAAIILIVFLHGMSRRASTDLTLRLSGMKEIRSAHAPWLFRLVEELAQANRCPMPALYAYPGPELTAHFMGRKDRREVIAIPESLIEQRAEATLRRILTEEMVQATKPNRFARWMKAKIAARSG